MNGIESFWLFGDLTPADLQEVKAVAARRSVDDGAVLFRQGDPTPGLHLVEAGAIKIYSLTAQGTERLIDIVGPGHLCGEMGVVDAAPSVAWGQALGATRLWVVPPAAVERLLLTHPAICLKLCRVLAAKLRTAGRQLEETIFLGSRERVLCHLVRLAERHGRSIEGGLRLEVRLTHQEIAKLAGTARETVSRTLTELQDRGLLRFDGRHMVYPDIAAVRALSLFP